MSKIVISIEAVDADDMRTKIAQIAKVWGVDTHSHQLALPLAARRLEAVVAEEPVVSATEAVEPEERDEREEKPKTKRGRPSKKNAKAAEASEEVTAAEDATPSIAAVAEQITKDAAFAALTALVERTNMEVGREVIARFSVKKFSELPEDKYGEFITACQSATTEAASA